MAETVKRISVPVLYGMTTIFPVTLEMMIAHGQAVMRGARAASRVLAETGCSAVKLEGGVEMAETIRFRFSVRLKLPA